MSDNTMPERITQRNERHHPVEYIRADVAQAQLDAANARIAAAEDTATHAIHASFELQKQLAVCYKRIAELEAEYKLHRESSLADFLKQSDEHKAEIERLKSRVAFDCRQLLAERDKRIAELESLCRTMQNLSDVHGLLHGNALAHIAELEAALRQIAACGCETYTSGDCVSHGNRYVDAIYTADAVCDTCIANAVLSGKFAELPRMFPTPQF